MAGIRNCGRQFRSVVILVAEATAEPQWAAVEPAEIVTGDFIRATLGPFEHEGMPMPSTVRIGTVLNTYATPLGARVVVFCDLGFYVGTSLLPPYRFERLVKVVD
jgi:hypothetical protein